MACKKESSDVTSEKTAGRNVMDIMTVVPGIYRSEFGTTYNVIGVVTVPVDKNFVLIQPLEGFDRNKLLLVSLEEFEKSTHDKVRHKLYRRYTRIQAFDRPMLAPFPEKLVSSGRN